MKRSALITIAAAAAILSACSSTATSTGPVTPAATPAASQAASAPAAAGSSAPTAPLPTTCPEFEMTAAHMATYADYLGLNLGTNNDESPTLANMTSGIAAMQDLAPTCAPKAAGSIDALATAVAAVNDVYTTQPTGADVQKVNDALAAMSEAGKQMFTDLGMSTYNWD
jgi:hypothetical protein